MISTRVLGFLCAALLCAPHALASEPATLPAPDANAQSIEDAFKVFSGKTHLGYDGGHGNQIEYESADGTCFLWYPGNQVIVPCLWKREGDQVCFKYGLDTYNPVTRERGGKFECTGILDWKAGTVASMEGDPFGLASKEGVPWNLERHPKLDLDAALKRFQSLKAE